jgi:hypothetical protein
MDSGAYGDSTNFKAAVDNAKVLLKKQIVIMIIVSLLFCVLIFLTFNWAIPLKA